MSAEPGDLQSWLGRTHEIGDTVDPARVAAMAATLDLDAAPARGDALPPAWHWLFFNEFVRTSALAADGHPKKGGFLPPVALPRRMWAGSRLRFPGTLRVGAAATKRSEVAKLDVKEGRSGQLVFVRVDHRVADGSGVCIEEEHDIVYRAAAAPGAPTPAPPVAPTGAAWRRTIEPTATVLFRYSALTWNSHRIHYDLQYVTKEEGYPGLIVHGPLIATLLLELVRAYAPQRRVSFFSFRAVSPLFDTAPFTVNGAPDGDTVRLWAANAQGGLAMEATAQFAP